MKPLGSQVSLQSFSIEEIWDASCGVYPPSMDVMVSMTHVLLGAPTEVNSCTSFNFNFK